MEWVTVGNWMGGLVESSHAWNGWLDGWMGRKTAMHGMGGWMRKWMESSYVWNGWLDEWMGGNEACMKRVVG